MSNASWRSAAPPELFGADPEPCPMCDDTGYELSQEPGAFCTLCARGLDAAQLDESAQAGTEGSKP